MELDAGDAFGSRSIPEYLGDRFDSDIVRLLAAFIFHTLIILLSRAIAGGRSYVHGDAWAESAACSRRYSSYRYVLYSSRRSTCRYFN